MNVNYYLLQNVYDMNLIIIIIDLLSINTADQLYILANMYVMYHVIKWYQINISWYLLPVTY